MVQEETYSRSIRVIRKDQSRYVLHNIYAINVSLYNFSYYFLYFWATKIQLFTNHDVFFNPMVINCGRTYAAWIHIVATDGRNESDNSNMYIRKRMVNLASMQQAE